MTQLSLSTVRISYHHHSVSGVTISSIGKHSAMSDHLMGIEDHVNIKDRSEHAHRYASSMGGRLCRLSTDSAYT